MAELAEAWDTYKRATSGTDIPEDDIDASCWELIKSVRKIVEGRGVVDNQHNLNQQIRSQPNEQCEIQR
jgi:hypothetical protein